nr:FtsX-like permease family protein [uncultured Sphingobacterium sp.]
MIRNYIKIAWRNIRKNKGFSLLNMSGLTIGITCFLLLATYIYHESSYERFFSHADRIAYFSLSYKAPNSAEMVSSSTTPTGLQQTLQSDFPEIEQASRLYPYIQSGLIDIGNQSLKENKLIYADKNVFEILDYDFIEGNKKHVLDEPNQIVLTETLAKKYFPNESAINKTLIIDKVNWKVSGVIADMPSNTQFRFSAILSNQGLARYKEASWNSANDITIGLLKTDQSFQSVQLKLDNLVKDKFSESIKQGYEFGFKVEKLSDIHLHSKTAGTGNILYVYILMALGIALIVLTCINFTNLILANAIERKKEIGVKKVLGAGRKTIFFQFLFECSLMILISLIVSLVATWLLLPLFGHFMGVEMQINFWNKPIHYIAILAFFIILSLLAGGWPAYSISSSKPISIFRSKLIEKQTGISLSKVLIVFQFCISIFFIICTLFAGQQMEFIQSKNTGLDRSDILVLDGRGWQDKERQLLKDKLSQLNSVKGVTASYDSPVNIQGGYTINEVEGQAPDFSIDVTAIPIEKDFVSVFNIKSIAGSSLSDTDILRASDTVAPENSFIINTLAATAMGWTPKDAIGKKINLNGRKGTVKQVVESFNFKSLHNEITPVVLFPEYGYFGNIFIKLHAGVPTQDALNQIKTIVKEIAPKNNYDYHFLNDDFNQLYLQDQQTTRAMQLFSLITISIACMGLFALSTYTVQQRIKEIGIRKIVGASVIKIVSLLSVDFLRLVVIALAISIPFGWFAMHKWLANFAYHIELDWWIFILAGGSALLISFLTISYQTVRAAMVNPIDCLRDE